MSTDAYFTDKCVHFEDQNGKWSISKAENDLLEAAKNEEGHKMRELLESSDKKIDIDARDKSRKNVVHVLSQLGFAHLLNEVFRYDGEENMLDLNAKDAWGATALMNSMNQENDSVFETLVTKLFDHANEDPEENDRYCIEPDAQNEQGWGFLHFLASNTDRDKMVPRFDYLIAKFDKQLETRGEDDAEEVDLNLQTNMGETFLMQSLQSGHSLMLRHVLEEPRFRDELDLTVRIELKKTKGAEEDGSTLLILACQHNSESAVDMLLRLPGVEKFVNLQN
jgi:ankyrin repeat protein